MSPEQTTWSDVQPELLLEISQRLEHRSEIINFRSVCKTWQGSTPLSILEGKHILMPGFPLLIMPDLVTLGVRYAPYNIAYRWLVLVPCSTVVLRSNANPDLPPFLFTVEEMNPGKLHLRRPLSRSCFEELPAEFPANLSMSRFRIMSSFPHYTLSFLPESDDILQMKNRNSTPFRKVIFYVDPDKCANTNSPSLILLYDDGSGEALAIINFEVNTISPLHSRHVKRFDDIIQFKEKVIAVDRKGRAYWLENGILGKTMAVKEPVGEGVGSDGKKRLVVWDDELYLVHRCPKYLGVLFRVYKLNESHKKWDELKGIGFDRILIATLDNCFFVPAKTIPTWRGNSLVFSAGVFPAYNSPSLADLEIFTSPEGAAFDIAVFHFGSGECKPIESYPGYSTVLWPQTWLSTDPLPNQNTEVGNEAQNDRPDSSSSKDTSYPPLIQVDTQAQDHPNPDSRESLCAKDIGALGISIEAHDNTVVADLPTASTEPLEFGVLKMKLQDVGVISDLSLQVMGNREKLEGNLKEIEEVSTQIAEMKAKFLAKIDDLELMLELKRKTVCENLSDLDCFGKGISLGEDSC